MSKELIEAMRLAGAKANDLWKIGRTDIPPDQAVDELRRTYPDAFNPTFNARTAGAAEYEAQKQGMLSNITRDRNAAYQRRELERLGVKFEVKS